jgi:hypothetical protein
MRTGKRPRPLNRSGRAEGRGGQRIHRPYQDQARPGGCAAADPRRDEQRFASVFDGTWDQYIDDFATTYIADFFDAVFTHTEGFPGIKDPNVKDWFVAHQERGEISLAPTPSAPSRRSGRISA